MDPQWLLERLRRRVLWVSPAIVFLECGLLFPILPGDSLLFAVGLFIAGGAACRSRSTSRRPACCSPSAAFLGNVVGYEIGRAIGPPLYERDGRFIKKKYFDQTHEFFEKHGAKALVLGRFVPIVRTFITVVAGVGRMDRRHFFVWSGVGAVLWATGVTLLGYFLGERSRSLQDNLEAASCSSCRLGAADWCSSGSVTTGLAGRSLRFDCSTSVGHFRGSDGHRWPKATSRSSVWKISEQVVSVISLWPAPWSGSTPPCSGLSGSASTTQPAVNGTTRRAGRWSSS